MNDPEFGRWQSMASAPRDGTRVLVEIRASEQGAAEVDMVRWAKPDRSSEECWIAVDSDPQCLITYAEVELLSWMALPTPLPKLRSAVKGPSGSSPAKSNDDEFGGSGI